MLGININGEFLDLSPATTAQLERKSPFFNSDDLAEEYSLPFTFPYTPKNARLLGLQNHFYTRRLKILIEARLYDNNNFSYTGNLVLTAAKLNANDVTQSTISGYFSTGASSFFSQIKDKKLKELSLGGVRQYVWTNSDPDSSNIGFWQIVHKSLDGTMEFSFAPIRNSMWSGSNDAGTPDWMNKLNAQVLIDYDNNYNTLAPQISLKYLLTQICEEHGWLFDYSSMPETSWQTLFMPSFYAVTWQKILDLPDPPFFTTVPLPTITMNLQNHVPPDVYIQNLIIWLRNRYYWGFEFDSSRKTVRMFALKNLADGTKKDFTKYMSANWDTDFSEDKKIFAFKNTIDGNDALSSSPDFTKATYGTPVANFADLPAPTENNFNLVIYVWRLNQYYQCRWDEDNHVYEWDIFGDGIYNFEPNGNNQSFETEISTMPVYNTLYRSQGVTDYYGLFPLCEQEGNWEGKKGDFKPWGVRLLFHRGKVWEANPLGFQGVQKYPYLTSICFTPTQTEADLEWSNVYVHTLIDNFEKGIIEFWWKPGLKYLQQSEVATGILYLPRTELVNLKWSDVILLKNIPYVGNKITEIIPYDGTVKAELRRVG
jgi:hypothetical protein